VQVIVAGYHYGVIAGGIGVGIPIRGIVIVNILQFHGSVGCYLQKIASGIGQKDGVISCPLHSGQNSQKTLVHFVVGRNIILHIDDIVGIGIEKFRTRSKE
jgi:hypothetical protein